MFALVQVEGFTKESFTLAKQSADEKACGNIARLLLFWASARF